MVWVRSEYAEELAVVSAWLMTLLPWSFSYGRPGGAQYFAIRFPFFTYERWQGIAAGVGGGGFRTPIGKLDLYVYATLTDALNPEELAARYGTDDPGLSIGTVIDALKLGPYTDATLGYLLWTVGLVVLLLAILLSVLLYVETDAVHDLPFDSVRAMGVLLMVAAVFYSGATIMLYLQLPGIYLPVGPFLYVAFGYILLTVDRT